MPDQKPAHRSDPRTLSEKQPGRSRNQDDPPPLTPFDFSRKKAEEQKQRVEEDPVPDLSVADIREARRRGAMPFGLKGSRKAAAAARKGHET